MRRKKENTTPQQLEAAWRSAYRAAMYKPTRANLRALAYFTRELRSYFKHEQRVQIWHEERFKLHADLNDNTKNKGEKS